MKKIIICINFLVLITSHNLYSQEAIAKLKYEDAEVAFNENDFKLTLKKLDEAEKLLGSTPPKIIYLRIMTYVQLAHLDTTFIQKGEVEADRYINLSTKVKIDKEKLQEVINVKKYLRKNVMAENVDRKRRLELEYEIMRKKEESEREIAEKFNSCPVSFSDLSLGMDSARLDNWLKQHKRQNYNDYRNIQKIIKAITNKTVTGALFLKHGEYTGGFIYSEDNKTVAGIFECPIYSENNNKLQFEYDRQKEKLIQCFGVSNIWEGDISIDNNEILKVVKLNNNAQGEVCVVMQHTTSPYSNYAWIFVFKLDYQLLNE